MVVHQLNWYSVWLPGWSMTVFCFVMVVHQLNWYCVWWPGWSMTVFCFVMVVHQLNWYCVWWPGWSMIICFLFCDGCSSVKLISVLQKNPPCPANSSVFQHLLHLWTLSSHDCMVLRSIFSHWGRLRNSNTTIKNGLNIHWCSRRKKHVLRAGGWKLLNRMKQNNTYVFKYIFF